VRALGTGNATPGDGHGDDINGRFGHNDRSAAREGDHHMAAGSMPSAP
jgi:hypothetical protein